MFARSGARSLCERLVKNRQGGSVAAFSDFCNKRITVGVSCVGSRLTKTSLSRPRKSGSLAASFSQCFERRPCDGTARGVDAMAIEEGERGYRAAHGVGERRRPFRPRPADRASGTRWMRWSVYVPGAGRFETVGSGISAPEAAASVSARRNRRRKARARPSSFVRLRGHFSSAFCDARREFHMMRASEPFLMEVDDEILLQVPCRPMSSLSRTARCRRLSCPSWRAART